MLDFTRQRSHPRTVEERREAARHALRRAIWYLVALLILLVLIWKPQLIVRFIR